MSPCSRKSTRLMSEVKLDTEAISTADRIINSVCQASKVTAEGKKWLKLAIDPFPDETRTCGGFPDMISSKSNVVPFKLTTTISGAAFATAWDCNIAFNGFLETELVRLTTQVVNTNKFVAQAIIPDFNIGGISVRSALTGTPLDITTTTANLLSGVPLDRPFRLISAGLEVSNETEPLYRSGKVVCYRQPTVPSEKFVVGLQDLAGVSVAPCTAISVTPLPETLADAQNIPDSTNWTAEEGGYLVFAMDGPTNPVTINPALLEGLACAPVYKTQSGTFYFPQIVGLSPVQQIQIGKINNSNVPFNNCGLFFADLSPQTKLDICWHLVIEEFPPPTDRTLMALSTPSAAYDPEALLLYSKALRMLPIAVPISENGLGTFFLEAAKSIASWAAPKLLKGLDDPNEKKEDHELAKIRAELEVLRELQLQQRSMRVSVTPRTVNANPNGTVKIKSSPPRIENHSRESEPRTKIVSNSQPRATVSTPQLTVRSTSRTTKK